MACSWLAPPSHEDQQERAVAEALRGDLEWDRFVALVDRHRIPSLAFEVLRKFGGPQVPDPVRSGLQARSGAFRAQALLHAAELVDLSRALSVLGIPHLPLKGAVLSQRLYGDLAMRQAKDLDLLVRVEDLGRAEAALLERGWTGNFTWAEFTPRQRRFLLETSVELEYHRPDRGSHLDLHWSLHRGASALVTRLWARAVPSEWNGASFLQPRAEDLFLALCTHGAVHAWFRLKWLGDLAAFAAREPEAAREGAQLAKEDGTFRMVEQGLRLACDLYGVSVPGCMEPAPGDARSVRLASAALEAIHGPEIPEAGPLSTARGLWKTRSYLRDLNPAVTVREQALTALFCLEDFRQARLPDRLFALYLLLRPVLWLRRRLGKTGPP